MNEPNLDNVTDEQLEIELAMRKLLKHQNFSIDSFGRNEGHCNISVAGNQTLCIEVSSTRFMLRQDELRNLQILIEIARKIEPQSYE